MAKYELKKLDNGSWRIWARFQPSKNGPSKSRVVTVGPDSLAKGVGEAYTWVAEQRKR